MEGYANGDWLGGRCIFNDRPSWKTNLNRLLIRAHSIHLAILFLRCCYSLLVELPSVVRGRFLRDVTDLPSFICFLFPLIFFAT